MNGRALPTLSRLGATLGGRLPPPNARIGLLGGSFNPAHEGHREISLEALRRLGLDEVWWLVSPQNPLKSSAGMAPFEDRMASAQRMVRHPRIRVTGLENALGTRFTADSLATLSRRFPRVRFVWLMGADNLVQLSSWGRWQEILNTVVIAVFNRPSYHLRANAAVAARRYARARIRASNARHLTAKRPPAWTFLHNRLNAQSATEIRAQRGSGLSQTAQRDPTGATKRQR